MLLWFGPNAFAPICDFNERTEIPIGFTCDDCEEPFVAEDFGILIPGYEDDLIYHRDCFLHMLGISPR